MTPTAQAASEQRAAEFACGRRSEGGVASRFPGPDHWRDEADSYRIGPTCSYCGSIPPDVLFDLIASGAKIGPTDKNYKIYVEAANPTPDALRYKGSQSGGDVGQTAPGPNYKRPADLTDEERAVAIRDGALRDGERQPNWIDIGPAGPTSWGKFYFQHLSDDEKRRFVDLINAKTMNIGEPGYFYVLPYFVARPAD